MKESDILYEKDGHYACYRNSKKIDINVFKHMGTHAELAATYGLKTREENMRRAIDFIDILNKGIKGVIKW